MLLTANAIKVVKGQTFPSKEKNKNKKQRTINLNVFHC